MKTTLALTALASLLVGVPAYAQMNSKTDSNESRTTSNPPAVADPANVNKTTAAPVEGKNSFTEGQVISRLEENGYSNVTGLMKDEQSVWHASASKMGKQVDVAVDYQGNITVGTAAKAPVVSSTMRSNSDAKTSTTMDKHNNQAMSKDILTESQAMKRIEDQGYSSINDLKKDDKSIWRANATKSGKQVAVMINREGVVSVQ